MVPRDATLALRGVTVNSATLDSNMYVSALEFGGVGARFLGMARASQLRIDTSDAILDENHWRLAG